MSRHRAVRNLNLDDELAEDDDFDVQDANPYDDISEDDRAQLEDALAQLVEVLGQPGNGSGFTEREMKDTLWDTYFDVDQSVASLVEERSRREQKEKRKADPSSPEPPLTALQRLTLERRSSNGRAGTAIRSRGRGRGFLAAGLSRDDLHLESRGEKRPAEQTGFNAQNAPEASTSVARPSKLAALAAARASNRQNKIAIGASSSSATAEGSSMQNGGKPLTKLQQKMQANMLAREQRLKGIPSKEDEAKALSVAENQKRMHTLPNGDSIDSLFPVDVNTSTEAGEESVLGRLTAEQHSSLLNVPGGSPFQARNHLEAFIKPSPDDLVLKAREGTNLAQKR